MKCIILFSYLLSSSVIAKENITTNSVELFWGLSSTGWSAISSILTLIAIMSAMFLPFLIDRKKKNNICDVITEELNKNKELLKSTIDVVDFRSPQKNLTRHELIIVMIRNIDLTIWRSHKNLLAEISANKFKEFLSINNLLERIHMGGQRIEEKKFKDPYLIAIFKDIDRCNKLMNN